MRFKCRGARADRALISRGYPWGAIFNGVLDPPLQVYGSDILTEYAPLVCGSIAYIVCDTP